MPHSMKMGIMCLFNQFQFILQLEDSRHSLLKSMLSRKAKEGFSKLTTEIPANESSIDPRLLACQGRRDVLELP